jgi:hypothetical protein
MNDPALPRVQNFGDEMELFAALPAGQKIGFPEVF